MSSPIPAGTGVHGRHGGALAAGSRTGRARRRSVRGTGTARQRGLSMSVLMACLVPLFVLCVGLVVDSAHRAADARQVSVVAAQAARAGSDASAASRLTGGTGAQQALEAARGVLADHGVDGEVQLSGGRLTVHAHARTATMFLQLVGIDHFDVSSSVTSDLVRA